MLGKRNSVTQCMYVHYIDIYTIYRVFDIYFMYLLSTSKSLSHSLPFEYPSPLELAKFNSILFHKPILQVKA